MIFQKGFTLIEIIIVIAILGLIASFGMVVDFGVFKGDTFRAEESTIVSILQRARSRAMANMFDSAHGVCYDTATDNYVIFRGSICDAGASTSELFPANINIAEHASTTFPTEIVFDRLTGNTTGDTIHIEDGTKSTDIIINNEGTINW